MEIYYIIKKIFRNCFIFIKKKMKWKIDLNILRMKDIFKKGGKKN